MVPFYVLALGVLALGVILCEVRRTGATLRLRTYIFMAASGLALLLFASLRSQAVGVDYKMYADYFAQMRAGGFSFLISAENPYQLELGYSLINYLVSIFTSDVRVFMSVMALVITALAVGVILRDSPNRWMSMFVFLTLGGYLNSLNFLRQCVAIGIYMFAIRYLKEKKLLPYLALVVLSATFHKAMLIMIPIYLIVYIKINWKTLVTYAVGTVLIMVLSNPIFDFVTQFVYKNYAETDEGRYYWDNGRDWQTALMPVILMLVAVLLKKFLLERNENNAVLIHMSILSGILYIMTCQHFLFQRFGMVFFTTAIFTLPELLASIGRSEEKAIALEAMPSLKTHTDKAAKKAAFQERRKLKSQLNWQKYYYRYAAIAVVVFGLLYYVWYLLQNRTFLTPYNTFIGK